ncbi:MAG TPA: hypothetical protein VEF06_08595, partial [Bryobacteraceae bacterium]|nr:hypothetical protein [Bryobacteraceae bacterium]
PIQAGDVMLLSSDGLHGVVSESVIERILNGTPSLEEACKKLIAAAHEVGSPDNVTVLLIRRKNPSPASPAAPPGRA